jgi:hypothetical protein
VTLPPYLPIGIAQRLPDNPADAAAVGIDPNHIAHTQRTDLGTATEKARRDAPAIPVYDVAASAP